MIPSAQAIQRIAASTEFRPGAVEKVLRLLDLLAEINTDSFLKGRLALKGGTALNLFHLNMPRLSVDIDLNYVAALGRSEMLRERPRIDDAISSLLASRGYAIRRTPQAHAGGKWATRFNSALGGNATLEVDVNYMHRAPLFGMKELDSCRIADVQATGILVLDVHEIVAGKLVALIARNTARDLFDARSIIEMDELDWPRIKAAVLAFGASGRTDWRDASTDGIGRPRESLDKLAHCLKARHFEEHGGVESWLTETIQLCRYRLSGLVVFSAAEQAFLDALLEQGVMDVSQLDVDERLRTKLKTMPMLAWKAQHVRDAQR